MASIENRSRTLISVSKRTELTKYFSFDQKDEATQYTESLKAAGHKPKVSVLDEAYLVRYWVNGARKSFTATTAAEAVAIKQRIESEQHHGLFVDYSEAHRTTMADLLVRYLKEEAPRKKGFLVIGYNINMWLEDAGLERQDLAAIHAAHPNPQDPTLKIPKPSGRRVSAPSGAASTTAKPVLLSPRYRRRFGVQPGPTAWRAP